MTDEFAAERKRMVDIQIRARGVRDQKVLVAMEKVPRHLFVPEGMRSEAYADEPLPIGDGQTISQPYIVAYMTEALKLRPDVSVLEIGTGSGYQTAVLAEIALEVYTMEILGNLSGRAREILSGLGYNNIRFSVGDGTKGWPEHSPYQAIMVTAAAARVPGELERQLGDGGRMICPVGTEVQELILVERKAASLQRRRLLAVRFVPLVNAD